MSEKRTGANKINQRIVMLYFLIMTVVYPFYAPGGYLRIGEAKYGFFRCASLILAAAVSVVILLLLLVRRDKDWLIRNYKRMSITDWFAYGYLVAVMLSYLCSDYKRDALWGTEGWYMGVMTQIMLILIYFIFSRYFDCDLRWLGVWLLSTAAVFVLGICNRYSIYPISMEGQTEGFISTLGNINWFCGYWSVTMPIGAVLYWCTDRKTMRILAGVYSVIAMVSGITQGSSSAYLVFIAVFLLLFVLSLGNNRKFYRFLELCMMFAASCQLGRFMCCLPGLEYNYVWQQPSGGGSGISMVLLDSNSTVWMFLFLLVCYMLFHALERRGLFHIEKHKWLWGIITAVVVMIVGVVALFLLIDTEVIYFRDVPGTMEYDGYWELVFDEDWGNGRGATWNCGMDAYRSLNAIHKIVGVGADCFANYVYSVPELAHRLMGEFGNLRLTNAHSEQITLLVNVGALGWVCYVGIFVSAFVRYMRGAGKQLALYLCAVSILAYTVHNMVSFQQVLSTPFVFILLGIGERFYRCMTWKEC
ncbi:MAG: O-antigen ligase family protein [Eubacterium sp.]|nr:O-antigen ligase family protein [Eubacterium sp.]